MRARENAKSPLRVNAQTVAQVFGLTVRRIQQLTQDGILVTEADGKRRVYDLPDTVQRYIRYVSERLNAKSGIGAAEIERRKALAEAELKEAKAEIASLDLKELWGQMHRSEDVEQKTMELVYAIRAMLQALPGRLAMDLAAITKPAEVSERLKTEINHVLSQLSNHEYDAEAYKECVRERQGREGGEDPADDGGDGGEQT